MWELPGEWGVQLKKEMEKEYFQSLEEKILRRYETGLVFPPKDKIFDAFEKTPLSKVKVVILGQDPYHNEGQAHGLSFSVMPGTPIPQSLKNIYKELQQELNIDIPQHGYLEQWANQGVLLLNTVLTVDAHTPMSHRNLGWERFTDAVIAALNEQEQPMVFLLWGKAAQEKKILLTNEQHCVLEAAHPSPFSARKGFFGCQHFMKANEYLVKKGVEPIDWSLEAIVI